MYLLDTNILSEVLKKKPHAGVLARLSETPRYEQYTSCLCVFELRYGSQRRTDHESFWEKIVQNVLSHVTALPLLEREILVAADVFASLSKKGRGISFPDLFIGATAIANNLTLVTANIRHFKDIPHLRLENWMENA